MKDLVVLKNSLGHTLNVTHSTFPAGEVYVRIDDDNITGKMTVCLYDASADSIMRAVMLADACENAGAVEVHLHAPYLPYSRQDRVCSKGESYSLKVFMRILRESFDRVYTKDLHNPKADSVRSSYITNLKTFEPFEKVLNIRTKASEYLPRDVTKGLIVAPDRGAVERAFNFANGYSEYPIAVLDKIRVDGGITSMIGVMSTMETAIAITIVDDICDGGATFIKAAELIRSINKTAKLYLLVSHGIFSAGTTSLLEIFDNIYVDNNEFNLRRLNG